MTNIKHPWTNGQVERMNLALGSDSQALSLYDDHAQLHQHRASFIDAYNFGRGLKTLKGPTLDKFVYKQRTSEPERFRIESTHLMQGLNT